MDTVENTANTDVAYKSDNTDNNKDNKSEEKVFANDKHCSHIYFPPSALLAQHVCAK